MATDISCSGFWAGEISQQILLYTNNYSVTRCFVLDSEIYSL